MKRYDVGGMNCAACSARVEKAVGSLDGVLACSVNLLTNSMIVEGDVAPSVVIEAVECAGYTACETDQNGTKPKEDALQDHETPKLLRRLIVSLCFLLPLMFVSMGSMMGIPQPSFLEHNHLAGGMIQFVLTTAVLVINQRFFISGVTSACHGAPNMDTLVSLGSGAAFVYSTGLLLLLTGDHAHSLPYHFYFESSAMIVTLITVGKLLEAYSKGKTTNALKSLMNLTPKTAVVIKNDTERVVPIEHVAVGDVVVIRAGESVPIDGRVLEGSAAVDESALTGESIPVDKTAGDTVSAGTMTRSGYMQCEVTRIGEDTTLQGIIRMVGEAAATKAPIAKLADKVSGVFVPIVLVLALITACVWWLVGESFGFAMARAISVLVISCPCALGLATPVAIMVGSGVGAKNGILFKTATSLEQTGKADIVVLDKTGTITRGQPRVTTVLPAEGISQTTLIQTAVSLESKSEHPLASAIVRYADEQQIFAYEVSMFTTHAGSGVQAECDGVTLYAGNARFLQQFVALPADLYDAADLLTRKGETPLWFSQGETVLGVIAVADVLKDDSQQAVSELQHMGLRVVMLTGDTKNTADTIARQAGITEVVAEVLPSEKEAVVRRLQADGTVVMVGDGINDAPALTSADIGMAIGSGTDIAVDAADVVLMNDKLVDVAAAIRLSRFVLRNIRENLFWAFVYNVIGIPLAAGVWVPLLGWELNPMFGAAAMSLSSACVVLNALRLNIKSIYGSRHKKATNILKKEKSTMTKTMKIEGMMCPHCSARVKKTLEALEGVSAADVSHESGTAIVICEEAVTNQLLQSVVEAQGYSVTSVQ